MDNKQNRQFYWEVKQFVNNNHTPKAPEVKNASVKDAISGILNENFVYRQNMFNKNSGTNNIVSSYLDVIAKAEKKQSPESVAYTKNKVSNPFNLMEISTFMSNAGKMLSGIGFGQVPTDKAAQVPEKQEEQPKPQETGGAMRYGRPIPSNVDVSGSFGNQDGGGYPSQRDINLKRAGEERLAAEKQRKQREEDRAETKRQDELTALLKDTEEHFKGDSDYAKRVREAIEGGEAKTAKDVERELGTEFRQGIRDLRITRERDKRTTKSAESLYKAFRGADIKDLDYNAATNLYLMKQSFDKDPEEGKMIEDKLAQMIRTAAVKGKPPEVQWVSGQQPVKGNMASSVERYLHLPEPSDTPPELPVSPLPSRIGKANIEKAQEAEEIRKRALGFFRGDTEKTIGDVYRTRSKESRERIEREENEKRANTAISPSYASVTPASFQSTYGVAYDPRNPKHGTMIQALHGENTGRSVEGAGTVKGWKDVMGVQAGESRVQKAQKDYEESSRRVKASQLELDRWRSLPQEQKMAEAWKESQQALAANPALAAQYPELAAVQKAGTVPEWASGKPRPAPKLPPRPEF